MLFFLKKELKELPFHLKNSFSRVKQDLQNLSHWIHYLHQKTQEQEKLLHTLHQQQTRLLQQIQNHSLSSSTLYSHLYPYLHQLSQKIDLLFEKHHQHSQKLTDCHQKITSHHQKLDSFHQRLQDLENQRTKTTSSLKEKMIRTFSRHSKTYLKNILFQYLEQHPRISALQLKDIFVDQQGLASKSTFYRLLAEIETSPQVTVIKEGKQKYFLLKTSLKQ